MNPLLAHKADGEAYAADSEIRRYKNISASVATFAIASSEWETQQAPLSDDERAALSAAFTRCYTSKMLNPDGHNKPTKDDVLRWSEYYPEYSFFHQANEGEVVVEIVDGVEVGVVS